MDLIGLFHVPINLVLKLNNFPKNISCWKEVMGYELVMKSWNDLFFFQVIITICVHKMIFNFKK
jgi:hypothetical protein